jgi:hypothetical protein
MYNQYKQDLDKMGMELLEHESNSIIAAKNKDCRHPSETRYEPPADRYVWIFCNQPHNCAIDLIYCYALVLLKRGNRHPRLILMPGDKDRKSIFIIVYRGQY